MTELANQTGTWFLDIIGILIIGNIGCCNVNLGRASNDRYLAGSAGTE